MLVSQNGLSRLHDQLESTVHRVSLLLLRSQEVISNRNFVRTSSINMHHSMITDVSRPVVDGRSRRKHGVLVLFLDARRQPSQAG